MRVASVFSCFIYLSVYLPVHLFTHLFTRILIRTCRHGTTDKEGSRTRDALLSPRADALSAPAK